MANSFFDWASSLTRFVRFDAARAEEVNAALDEVSAGFDDVEIKTNAALKLPDGETAQSIGAASARKGRLLGFNATTGDLETLTTIGDNRGDWATSTAYNLRDIVKDSAGSQNIYQCAVAHTSGILTTDVLTGKWHLLVDAQSATNSAAAAAASESAAAASAAAAAASESAAADSESAMYSVMNFKGNWSALTGPLNMPSTVLHNGAFWVLLNNLANVTTSEPGISADWQKASGSSTAKIMFIASSF